MLEIKKITKVYNTSNFKQKALDNISFSFRKNEFVAILGPSGSGKTTLLNIIGGLDKYTSGDLIIDGISTKEYNDSDWDSYRNHRIGFVFQSYNLITHQSILSNVMLALTLSGISKKDASEKAKKALKDVGLSDHMYKKPNELSGGQMQRVAIARALVNNPDILLADEPTGALDSETSIQIMNLLKNIAKEKLVIMVTHNPELAKEYASRIITLKDGKITSDSNPYVSNDAKRKMSKVLKTSMSFKTALTLSFNNLMTKRGRTILVSLAGSIGIIGIALILAVSTGFQNYIDTIQEETLTSYPLIIMNESTDVLSTLLSLNENHKRTNTEVLEEKKYISNMLSSISTNDLKNFKKYIEDNQEAIKDDVNSIKYSYSIEPLIYTIDKNNKLAKLNPNNIFNAVYGNSTMMTSYTSMTSVYSQMIDNIDALNEQYDVLKGRWPSEYDEVIIVLNEPNVISDLLVYSLGLRDIDELNDMVNKILAGETIKVKDDKMTFTYDDVMNVELKLIKNTDTYRYNSKYDIYENMIDDESYMKKLYEKAGNLKIVGIVAPKEGINSLALTSGVAYTKELINYIIDESSKTEVVKKQIENESIDIFSGSKFSSNNNKLNFDFADIVTIDNRLLKEAFNIEIDKNKLNEENSAYMEAIEKAITTDINPAKEEFKSVLDEMEKGLFNSITDTVSSNEIEEVITNYLESIEVNNILKKLETKYVISSDAYKKVYSSLLKGLLSTYIEGYYLIDSSLTEEVSNKKAIVLDDLVNNTINNYNSSIIISTTTDTFGKIMTESKMKKDILTNVGMLTSNVTKNIANSFNVNEEKLAKAFKLNLSDKELKRIINTMLNTNETNAKTNLISLGYQDKEDPTRITLFFSSFEGKEHFLSFLDNYNNIVSEEKKINYTDTTGILMSSVKTIVNAVSYVLIAFVSISLIVSSIMIGIITYISVYERTKEIGILRAIGASKKNISSIFNAETFIIGMLSGLFGIGITYILIPIINMIIHHYTGSIPLNAILYIPSAIILILLSIGLTIIGGLIPAKSASKKDPVIALRTE